MNAARDWVSFWDQPHSIYVNARHLDAHYRDVAGRITALIDNPEWRVLDYGCGEATHAGRVAAAAARLYLCESAPSVRDNLRRRFAGNAKIAVIGPEDLLDRADGTLDFIVMNSVAQYLSSSDLDRLLALFRRLLSRGGQLIVGDIIPPDVGAASDVMALLRYATANGFLIAALLGLARTVLSDYRSMRARLGIATYTEQAFLAKLAAAGFSAERLPFNLEHNPGRMSFRARKAS
jgi:SAM-dependent methyltransferase